MIPSIGVMIGFYIITRMLSFLTRSGDRAELSGVKVMALVTIAVAILVILSLFGGNSSTP